MVHPVPEPVPTPETDTEREARLAWERARLAEAEEDIKAGRYIEGDEAVEWLESELAEAQAAFERDDVASSADPVSPSPPESGTEREARLAWERDRLAEAEEDIKAGRVMADEELDRWLADWVAGKDVA